MDILNTIGNIFLEQSEFWWLAFLFLFGWVWTLKVDNVDTVMAAHVNDLQDLKVDTDEVPILQNILGGSLFGTWSQSDANKGLGWLTYDAGNDNGVAPPAVGDVATGVTSGAVAKVISYTTATGTWPGTNATGVITLGACSSTTCFNDNETVNFTSGASCLVNHPVAVVGVDGIVKNGAFVPIADDPPTGWLGGNSATLSTEAGGVVGNCLMITENGGANPYAHQLVNTEIGKIYKISLYVKQGTEATWSARVSESDWSNSIYINPSGIAGDEATGAWVRHTLTFEAWVTQTRIQLRQTALLAAATTLYFDEITLYEITPCCTAVDSLAWDGDEWTKDNTLDLYREHWDGGTNTKEGSFYALRCVPSHASDYINWRYDIYDSPEHLAKFLGRTVIVGMWAKTSTVSHFRISIYEQGGASINSAYHPGDGNWHWIEVPYTFGTTATWLYMQWRLNGAPNVDGSTIVYLSQPMFIFCPAVDGIIGEGNYTPRYQEWIYCDKFIPGNRYDNTTGWGTVAWADLNLEADSDAMIPKGAKAIKIHIKALDSGSGALVDVHIHLRKSAAAGEDLSLCWGGRTNSVECHASGMQPCSPDGDVEIELAASGGATLDIVEFRYMGVQVI